MKRIVLSLMVLCCSGGVEASDISIFGIAVGKPLDMPCITRKYGSELSRTEPTCFRDEYSQRPPDGLPDLVSIAFPPRTLPDYVRPIGDRWVEARLIDENVEYIDFGTFGADVQDIVFADLKKKFGKPTSFQRVPLQNQLGVSHIGLEAKWRKKGVIIEFQGIESEFEFGHVRVSTDKFNKTFDAWEKRSLPAKQAL